MSYAKNTIVPVDRSQAEIKRVLQNYEVDEIGFLESAERFSIYFRIGNLRVEIKVPLPRQDERNRDQIVRQRWRALLLVIKAKLEVIDVGISTLEQEFLPYVVTKTGRTIGETLIPQLEALSSGAPLLPMLPERIA